MALLDRALHPMIRTAVIKYADELYLQHLWNYCEEAGSDNEIGGKELIELAQTMLEEHQSLLESFRHALLKQSRLNSLLPRMLTEVASPHLNEAADAIEKEITQRRRQQQGESLPNKRKRKSVETVHNDSDDDAVAVKTTTVVRDNDQFDREMKKAIDTLLETNRFAIVERSDQVVVEHNLIPDSNVVNVLTYILTKPPIGTDAVLRLLASTCFPAHMIRCASRNKFEICRLNETLQTMKML